MQLKTYRARTMADALAEVKRDLGKDAVILHTRTFKVGGWLGIGARTAVEVTASIGDPRPAARERRAAAEPARPVARPSLADPVAITRAYGSRPAAAATPARRAGQPTEPEQDIPLDVPAERPPEDAPRIVRSRPAPVQPSAPPVASAAESHLVAAMSEELAAIRRMVGHVLQSSRQATLRAGRDPALPSAAAPGAMPDALFEQYLRLLESEVAAEIADEIIGQVRDELSPGEMSDSAIVRETVLRRLAALVPADATVPAPAKGADGRPLTIALVGPTGVGKTTTVAKLAAAYKLRHGKRVGLVTSDTYRIAAVDQLRTYADIIGLPLKVALTAADMEAACAALADCDVIIIDTAGRSPNDSDRLSELRRFIDAARPHQTHLVLSSTASEAALLAAAGKFAQVFPDRVIFTKLDEAVNFGVIVTVARRISLKLSYVTTGQEVPDHIEVGRPERLARLVLDHSARVRQDAPAAVAEACR